MSLKKNNVARAPQNSTPHAARIRIPFDSTQFPRTLPLRTARTRQFLRRTQTKVAAAAGPRMRPAQK